MKPVESRADIDSRGPMIRDQQPTAGQFTYIRANGQVSVRLRVFDRHMNHLRVYKFWLLVPFCGACGNGNEKRTSYRNE
jgi:hypothetical protein